MGAKAPSIRNQMAPFGLGAAEVAPFGLSAAEVVAMASIDMQTFD